ncbi:MAG: aspartate-semialdehyde dehydrogenase [Bacillati bacterium ANGP1]|uniref:Aspartate-semialdehyde dehydrogenase n=1 Tax=Candidatus Segetimicrobium genomatis TaxID=2569760 RepID=A0A537LNZ3_9BACT|nr:MAG: aspartate-semialdehyde dehydrogenase [Terrabacteria group bacterium ANGP1]
MAGYHVAVVGATGAVGQTVLRVLEERAFPVASLRVTATERSAGRPVSFRGEAHTVVETSQDALRGVQIAFFGGGDGASERFARRAAASGTLVIDKSSTFRMEPDVPLVIPEVNRPALRAHRGIIANPNCSTIAMVMALAPLHDLVPIRRVVACTYQSASGAGRDAMEALLDQSRRLLDRPDLLRGRPERVEVERVTGTPLPVAFNAVAQWTWMPGGITEEEDKMVRETRKIMDADLGISVTTVRVPVLIGHLIALHVEFAGPVSIERARARLAAAPGVEVADDWERGIYPTPLYATGRDACLVGRLRPDPTVPHGVCLLAATDNLRKGAALNAVQIAEAVVEDALLAASRV